MNINLANIDFIPGQGGGGSLTPDEQKALDTLVDSSEGVLNTFVVESEGMTKQSQKPNFTTSDWYKYLYDVDGEIYCRSDNSLFKYNPETLSFDYLFNLSQYNDAPLWKDNSGRLYQGVSNQIDIENKTVTNVYLGRQYQYYENSDNIYKGKYGIYILTDSSASKFDEKTQKFRALPGSYATDYTDIPYNGDIKEYDGHIIIVKNGSFYELVETEYSITIESVNPYFNIKLPNGNYLDSFYFYNVGNDYYYFYNNNDKFKLVNNEWVRLENKFFYYFNRDIQLVSSNGLFILRNVDNLLNSFILFNPGTSDYKKTSWTKISDVAVDLSSDQQISGYKRFNSVHIETLETNKIGDLNNDIHINSNQASIVLRKQGNIELNCDNLFKNNTIIPTIDDIIVNKTITYPGKFINEVTTSSPKKPVCDYVWTTPSGRLFVFNSEWDFSTSNWIRRKFKTSITNTKSRIFTTSFGLTYITSKNFGQIYVWNDSSSNWDLKYENPDNISLTSDPSFYWVYGGDLYYGYDKKFDPNNLEWISGEYCTNFSPIFSMCNLGNDTYIRNSGYQVKKYNSSTKTFDRIAQNQIFRNGYLFKYNNDLYINDDEDVFKYNTSTDKFDKVDNIGVFNISDQNIYFELDGKLYTVKDEKIGYVYDLNINAPEVPASDGTYTLKAVRAGKQITYNWVLDA